ncbi:hypothetical protein T484DRAFT_1988185, partial [Baffinella frigidus]
IAGGAVYAHPNARSLPATTPETTMPTRPARPMASSGVLAVRKSWLLPGEKVAWLTTHATPARVTVGVAAGADCTFSMNTPIETPPDPGLVMPDGGVTELTTVPLYVNWSVLIPLRSSSTGEPED